MSISIRTNIPALVTQRYLNSATNSLEKSMARLSSGLRIINAADDAAGLAIAEQLRSQSRVATVAMRNANDGISVLNIVNGAVDEMSGMLTRMAELAEQSANGVYSAEQRNAMQAEYVGLAAELQRIAMTTQFNDRILLSGSIPLALQVGFDGGPNSQIEIPGMDVTLLSLGLATDPAGQNLIYSLTDLVNVPPQDSVAQQNARDALDAFKQSLEVLNALRGVIGSTDSRLSVAATNLETTRDNYRVAEGQIRDVDVAFESAQMARLLIVQEAAVAMLTQANQQPALALNLLTP